MIPVGFDIRAKAKILAAAHNFGSTFHRLRFDLDDAESLFPLTLTFTIKKLSQYVEARVSWIYTYSSIFPDIA